MPITRRYYQIVNKQLQLAEDMLPPLQADEVLIKTVAIGINRGDILQCKGLYPAPADASSIPGLEASGTIIACGENVSTFKTGDSVCALCHGGAYADHIIVKAHQCFNLDNKNPVNLTNAAALPEALFTVWHNVFERGKLQNGEKFLVQGGASGIGHIAYKRLIILAQKLMHWQAQKTNASFVLSKVQ